jgi:multiple sugar transport system permease protein
MPEADLFFILSTEAATVVVAIPMFLMYAVGLVDTHAGLIILYTAFNLSFSIWLVKGFMDEIPKEYEEAALVDGYANGSFFKIVLPQAVTGIAATAVFCLSPRGMNTLFALMMTPERRRPRRLTFPQLVG